MATLIDSSVLIAASRGATIEAHDLLIGATALAIGADVATRYLRNFPKIPGLKVTRW